MRPSTAAAPQAIINFKPSATVGDTVASALEELKTSSKKKEDVFVQERKKKEGRPPCRRLHPEKKSSDCGAACDVSMDPQLQALVAIQPLGNDVLLGHKLRQLLPGGEVRWCWPVRFDQLSSNWYLVQQEDYNEYPHPIPFNYLGVGLAERGASDPLIQLLKAKGQDVTPFLSRPAPAAAPIRVLAAMAATPGCGFQTPLPDFGADPDN
jgi:hypothetical protein